MENVFKLIMCFIKISVVGDTRTSNLLLIIAYSYVENWRQLLWDRGLECHKI